MTRIVLLERLKTFTEHIVRDLRLPVQRQETDLEPPIPRCAEVYQMNLPESRFSSKRAPFILHQLLTEKDMQIPGERNPRTTAVIRTVFCVYDEDAQEGGIALLNLMECLRVALLESPVLGNQFELDLQTGLESLIYPDDDPSTYPFYLGEMMSVWHLPPVKRLDAARVVHGMPSKDPKAREFRDDILLKEGSQQDGI